jgi:hypothetical protein
MASIQPLPLSDRRPLTGVDLPRPALVGEAVRDPPLPPWSRDGAAAFGGITAARSARWRGRV